VPSLERIKNALENPERIFMYLVGKGYFNWLRDDLYLKMVYRFKTGRRLELKKPATFNEKLQWLKLYDRNPLYTKLVDKYEVKKYVADIVGEEYIIPLIGVYDSIDDMDFNILPDKFVLKCTNDSGSVIICTNKAELNVEETRAKINKHLKRRYYYHSREWPYKNIKPRIVCEEFVSESDKPPEDYKVMCFNGHAKLVQIHKDRFSSSHLVDFYDLKWNKTSIHVEGFPNTDIVIPRPGNFEKMISLSEILSKDKHYVRIDWYVIGSKLYFGEITFFDASGFLNFENYNDDLLLGSWIKLPID
jgi:hypothetical protein